MSRLPSSTRACRGNRPGKWSGGGRGGGGGAPAGGVLCRRGQKPPQTYRPGGPGTRLKARGRPGGGARPAGAPPADNTAQPACAAPPALIRIEPALAHAAARIEQSKALTIVAVGSSSTQGVGASAPSFSYPSRLEAALKARLPGIEIRVINRGKGGEDAAEELERLRGDVIAGHPDLVIWQLGTNAGLRRDDLGKDEVLLRRGVRPLKDHGAGGVLVD